MTVFRDWQHTLRRASYGGASFFVETDKIETGRRLVIHEFPLKDVPYIEDMGRDTNKIHVTAYVVSNNADGEEKALRSVCERGGAKSLVLPMEALQAHCESCSREFRKDKLGFVAFDLKFVREGAGSGPFPAGFLASLVGQTVAGLTGALSARFLSGWAVAGMAGFVRDHAIGEVRGLAASLDGLARSLPLEISRATGVLEAIAGIYDDAEDLAVVGLVADRISSTSFVSALPSAASSEIVDRVTGVLEAARLAIEPDVAMREFVSLVAYQPIEPVDRATTPSRRRMAENAATLAEVVRMAALGAYANAAAARVYTDRREAIQARADAAEFFSAELEAAGETHRYQAWTELQTLSGRLAEYLGRRVADLAPVVGVEASATMPSLWWANRLYGSADRAGELVDRNRVIHASFMPPSFEALAR